MSIALAVLAGLGLIVVFVIVMVVMAMNKKKGPRSSTKSHRSLSRAEEELEHKLTIATEELRRRFEAKITREALAEAAALMGDPVPVPANTAVK